MYNNMVQLGVQTKMHKKKLSEFIPIMGVFTMTPANYRILKPKGSEFLTINSHVKGNCSKSMSYTQKYTLSGLHNNHGKTKKTLNA